MAQHKLTRKQEDFCFKYIELGNASEAYRQAYNAENMRPGTIRTNACELLKNGNVAVTLSELQAEYREAHKVTVDNLTAQLEADRQLAHDEGQAGAAVSATMGKAKLHGLLVDKLSVNGQMSVEVADRILKEAGIDPDQHG